MSTAPVTFERVLIRARQLEPHQQLALIQALAASVQQQTSERPQRRITELRGLGKELWRGLDAQEYVDRERDSWVR